MKTINTVCTLALASAMILPTTAFAGDNCRNVKVTVINHTGGEIKIKKIKHFNYDLNKWHSNSSHSRKLSDNYQTKFTKNLQQVKNDRTKVAVLYYQYNNQFSFWAYSSSFECNNRGTAEVDITKEGGLGAFIRSDLSVQMR